MLHSYNSRNRVRADILADCMYKDFFLFKKSHNISDAHQGNEDCEDSGGIEIFHLMPSAEEERQ